MFLKDKKVGDEGEEKVIQLLGNFGFPVQRTVGKNIKYDLECEYFTIEVKNDIYAAKSGNLAIEFFNSKSNKPSGIMATEADFWVHLACGSIFFCLVSELKEFLDNNTPDRIIQKGGDGNASLMLYVLESMCPPFEELTKDNFNTKLRKLTKEDNVE